MKVPIDKIRPSPYQPRLDFATDDLVQEIIKDGLLSKLRVREVDDYYELVDGERRFRALKQLGWTEIPIEIDEMDDHMARLYVYKANTIRKDYTIEERARYFKKLNDEGMTFYQIGKELSVDDQWVLTHLNVFKFPEELQQAVWDGGKNGLSIAHMKELEEDIGANINDAVETAKQIIIQNLDIFELRKLLKPKREAIEKMRLEAAKKALEERAKEGIGPIQALSHH